MSEALLTDLRFHRLLLAYDEDLAARARDRPVSCAAAACCTRHAIGASRGAYRPGWARSIDSGLASAAQ